MNVRMWSVLGITLLIAFARIAVADPAHSGVDAAKRLQRLPLAFEPNCGQAADMVRYLARVPGRDTFLTATGVTLVPPSAGQRGTQSPISMRLLHANPTALAEGLDPLSGVSNYFVGNNPADWQIGVPTYARVKYRQIYPGVDLIYYGSRHQLEYDFMLAPFADPKRIALEFSGTERLHIDAFGNLILSSRSDNVQRKPIAYQEFDGERRVVDVRYVLHGSRRVSFALGPYDESHALIIDPVLAYSTYLGGSGDDSGLKIAVDSGGNAYVTGRTNSANFPIANALQPVYAGNNDAFIAKLNSTGTALVYNTYLGGTGGDAGQGIAVDANGRAYVTGNTNSVDFPTTANAAQSSLAGGNDVFMTVLDSAGALAYSTYLGGSGLDIGTGIAVDTNNNAYVTGYTQSSDFPTTAGVIQRALTGTQDAFITKVSTAGAIVYSTYLGGGGLNVALGVAADGAGNATVVGYTQSANFPTTQGALQTAYGGGTADAFVARINSDGSALLYATYVGGSGDDYGAGVAVDGAGNAYVAGSTNSGDFPVTPGAVQASDAGGVDVFVSALDTTGSTLIYSSYLGGTGYDAALGIAVDTDSAAYVTGYSQSLDFPTTMRASQPSYAGGTSDVFIAQLTAVGALGYSSYLGGNGLDAGYGIAVDSAGTVYVTGNTTSSDFPTTLGAVQTSNGGANDVFVTAISAAAFDEIFRNGFE